MASGGRRRASAGDSRERRRRRREGRTALPGADTPVEGRTGDDPSSRAGDGDALSGQAPGLGYEITRRDGLAEIRLACGKANALNPRSLAALAGALAEARQSDAAG